MDPSTRQRNFPETSPLIVGNYSTPTAKLKPWLSEPVVHQTGKNRKSKMVPAVIHPLLKECADLVSDSYWVAIFNQAALGKFPKGFSFNDRTLIYKKCNKIQKLDLFESAIDALPRCIEFFRKFGGLISPTEIQASRQAAETQSANCKSIYDCKWSDIKSPDLKQLLFIDFATQMTKKYDLSISEQKHLSTVIHIGHQLGYFNEKNIHFENGAIEAIDGLIYDKYERRFSFDPTLKAKNFKLNKRGNDSNHQQKNYFSGRLAKHFGTYEKKYEKKYGANGEVRIISGCALDFEPDSKTTSSTTPIPTPGGETPNSD